MMDTLESWGRYPRARQRTVSLYDRAQPLPRSDGMILPRGNGRSYGDSCLNPGGILLLARGLDRFIAFDPATGLLQCEAGTTLADILELVVPQGWFVPVTPGTEFVTVGGAIANDVHGKNHHRAGTFGHHVKRFELLRSDGERIECIRDNPCAMFAATIGGLGLTGLITWAEIQLRRIPGPCLENESIRFSGLKEFFELSAESSRNFEYTVAWIDCLASGKSLGRGHFHRADHAFGGAKQVGPPSSAWQFPVTPPVSLVNKLTLRPFNSLYFHRQLRQRQRALVHFKSFFYPLDRIQSWNRMYGANGFLQYQCAVPPSQAPDVVAELLREIAASGSGSFLAVLKEFGDRPSVGMLSFPRPGTTLALDFANSGPALFSLLDRLDSIVDAAGGAIYPAKDARVSGAHFRRAYPRWREFQQYIDPAFSSGFWRRVME